MFDYQPDLQGKLLRVRPLRDEDYNGLLFAAGDPLIWRQHPAWDRYKPEEFKKYFVESMNSGGASIVEKTDSGMIVGSTRYHGYSCGNSEIEIGWTFLVRSCWGGVYNQELKNLTIEHAFKFVDNVVFLIDRNNIRSQKSVLKLGAVQFGVRKKPDGLEMLLFRICRNDISQ